MSQAKVDKYKVEKANRKETIAKEKRQRMIVKIVGSVIGIALVAWIGISAAVSIYNNRPVDTIYATTAGIDDYLNEIYADETEDDTEKSTEKAE